MNFMIVLLHDLMVHMFNIVLNTLVVVMDRIYLFFILIELELMIILDCLHIFSVFEIQDKLFLDLLDNILLISKLLAQVGFFTLIF